MLKIGLVGCGMVAGYGHLPAIAASKRWKLDAVCDVDPKRLAAVARKYRVPHAFADYRELMKHPGLDAVAITTHLDTHKAITLAALARGLHVMCEKPMAADLAECRSMVAAAKRAKRLLAVNFNSPANPLHLRMKELIDAGEMGTLRVVRFVLDWSCHQWQPAARLKQFMLGGGPVVDSAVHSFHAARWFTGREIESIDAKGVILPPWENPQHVIAVCRMTGGAVALVEAGWLYTKRTKDEGAIARVDVIGDTGAMSWTSPGEVLYVYTKTKTWTEPSPDTAKRFDIVYDRFAESVKKGRLVGLASGEDGLKATDAAYRALASAKRRG